MQQLDFIVNGGETRRFHTWPVLRPQRVDAHSHGVAMLYSLMAADVEPGISVPGLMYALTHDLAEHKVGDLPAPVKRALPAYERREGETVTFRDVWDAMEHSVAEEADMIVWSQYCTPEALRLIKLADVMEGCLYCIRERQMGNKLMATPFGNFRQYIRDVLGDDEPPAHMETQIINYIDDMWEQANG